MPSEHRLGGDVEGPARVADERAGGTPRRRRASAPPGSGAAAGRARRAGRPGRTSGLGRSGPANSRRIPRRGLALEDQPGPQPDDAQLRLLPLEAGRAAARPRPCGGVEARADAARAARTRRPAALSGRASTRRPRRRGRSPRRRPRDRRAARAPVPSTLTARSSSRSREGWISQARWTTASAPWKSGARSDETMSADRHSTFGKTSRGSLRRRRRDSIRSSCASDAQHARADVAGRAEDDDPASPPRSLRPRGETAATRPSLSSNPAWTTARVSAAGSAVGVVRGSHRRKSRRGGETRGRDGSSSPAAPASSARTSPTSCSRAATGCACSTTSSPRCTATGQRARLPRPRDVELTSATSATPTAVTRALAGVDAVFHLAAVVGVGQSMYEIANYTTSTTWAPPCCSRRCSSTAGAQAGRRVEHEHLRRGRLP